MRFPFLRKKSQSFRRLEKEVGNDGRGSGKTTPSSPLAEEPQSHPPDLSMISSSESSSGDTAHTPTKGSNSIVKLGSGGRSKQRQSPWKPPSQLTDRVEITISSGMQTPPRSTKARSSVSQQQPSRKQHDSDEFSPVWLRRRNLSSSERQLRRLPPDSPATTVRVQNKSAHVRSSPLPLPPLPLPPPPPPPPPPDNATPPVSFLHLEMPCGAAGEELQAQAAAAAACGGVAAFDAIDGQRRRSTSSLTAATPQPQDTMEPPSTPISHTSSLTMSMASTSRQQPQQQQSQQQAAYQQAHMDRIKRQANSVSAHVRCAASPLTILDEEEEEEEVAPVVVQQQPTTTPAPPLLTRPVSILRKSHSKYQHKNTLDRGAAAFPPPAFGGRSLHERSSTSKNLMDEDISQCSSNAAHDLTRSPSVRRRPPLGNNNNSNHFSALRQRSHQRRDARRKSRSLHARPASPSVLLQELPARVLLGCACVNDELASIGSASSSSSVLVED